MFYVEKSKRNHKLLHGCNKHFAAITTRFVFMPSQ